jgi:hypothetical protein
MPPLGVLVLALCLSPSASLAEDAEPCVLRVVHAEPPSYPEIAVVARVRSVSTVRVSVAADGSVSAVGAPSGDALFAAAVSEAAAGWKLEPSADPSEVRSVLLSFTFGISAEDSTRTRTEARFEPPASMTVTRILGKIRPLEGGAYPEQCPVHQIPLERGIVPIRYGLAMSCVEIVEIAEDYSRALPLVVNDDVLLYLNPVEARRAHRTYGECPEERASRTRFPQSNQSAEGACFVGSADRAEVMYCPACRRAEQEWRKSNPEPPPRGRTQLLKRSWRGNAQVRRWTGRQSA